MWIPLLAMVGCLGGDDEVPTAVVAKGPFEIVLAIPGELKAVRSETLSAPDLNGQAKITFVVDEGARVQAGDVLVRFDETELNERLEEAQTALEVAQTKIEQGKAQLEVRLGDLEQTVNSSQLSLQRAEMRVTESETVPRVERESAKLDVEESTIAVARARSAVDSARLEGQAELDLLRLDAERAKRQVAQAERALGYATVTAPAPGIVILPHTWKGGTSGPVTVGDTVWGGATLVELPDLSEMEVQAWVHEVDAAKIAVDQPVSIVIDAHPDDKHAARVSKVADLAVKRDRNATVKHLQVTIVLEASTEVMKPGMTVRAEVLVGREEDVISVPQEAVFHEDEETWVFRSGLGGFGRVPVTLGARNDTHVVVTSGLDPGDVVALLDPEKASDGPPSPGVPGPSKAAPAVE